MNPAWHFLRLFFALFQRITLGGTRLQEVLADRFAAAAYGGQALADGLRHIVRRSVEFSAGADAVITLAQAQRRAVANLYLPPPDGSVNTVDLEKALTAAMADAGSPYDSHPPVARRIAWLTAFGDASDETRGVTSDGQAWDLFPDRSRIEVGMTSLINERLEEAGDIDVPVPRSVASPLETGGGVP